ncbi:MAG: cytochrome C biogenesis protein [Candidatus Eisenbacteria bacterium]|nr:cytochrome C biogenesis protein [Candidatus Eisenbacteria bacterium]
MGELFANLTRAVQGAPLVALSASLAWGVLSVVLSPCHLASIPLIVGFVDGQGRISTRRAFLISLYFSVGILITIAAIGVATAAAGRIMGDLGSVTTYVIAGVLVLVGLHLIGLVPAPWSGPSGVAVKRKGGLAAFVLGLIFGVALGPCTFAYMAPMLGVVLGIAGTSLAYSVVLLLAYGIGHCAVIVLAGTFTEVVQRYLNWTERSGGAIWLRRACGVLVIAGGVYLLVTRL